MAEIKKILKNHALDGYHFKPCINDGLWLVSRWDVIHTNTNKKAVYIFGADGVHAAIFNKNSQNFQLIDLAQDTLIAHLEETPDEFKVGLFRFEFDGQRFDFCNEEPKWAKYDCGIIEN